MRIALLEDYPDQVEIVSRWLKNAEHSVNAHGAGGDFLRDVRRNSYDLYILDWSLPDISGIEVLKKLRDAADFTPVLITTARNDEHFIVQALEAGADDYLAKPIRERELLARVAALARRAAGGRPTEATVDASPYVLQRGNKTVLIGSDAIVLTSREFELAEFLFRNAGHVVSRAHILEAVWGIDNSNVSTRTVDTHISRLRKKLALGEDNGWILTAIYQHGYRLERAGSNSP